MIYKNYTADIVYSDEDKAFVGRVAGIRAIIGFHADTVKDLERAFRDSVDHYLASCARDKQAPQKPYSGRVLFRVSPDIHRRAAQAARMEGMSLNQWGEQLLERATIELGE